MASPTNPTGPSGGVSVISYLVKQKDGVIFSEGFENDNFVSADGWTTLQGSPSNSSTQFIQGIKSFDCNNGSLPVIKKVLNASQYSASWQYVAWFYDDATNTTDEGPFIKLKTSDGKYIQVGVRNGVSTTKYCCNAAATYTENNFAATSVTRTTGWKRLKIQSSVFGASELLTIRIEVAGVSSAQVFSDVISQNYISEIYVQSNTLGGSGSSFGYFDAIGVFSATYISINFNTPRAIEAYDSQNSKVQTSSGLTSEFRFEPTYTYYGTLIEPFNVFFAISSTTDVKKLSHRTNLMIVNPGDVYTFKTIDFGRKVTTYDPFINELQSVNISTAGVRETNNYGLKGDLTFSVNNLQGFQWRQYIDNFFLNAVQGNPFGLMVDNVTDNCFGVLSTSSAGGDQTITLHSNLGTPDPTSIFANKSTSTSDYYIVQNYANTSKQIVQVNSIGTSTLTLSQTLNFSTNPGDYICSLLYYPFLEVEGSSPTGFTVSDPSIPRYNWVQRCNEYDNG